jgi:hypothetical protein
VKRQQSKQWLRLRVILLCVPALLALATSAPGRAGHSSVVYAQQQAPDLCTLFQQLSGSDPVHLTPGVGDPDATTQCELSFTVQNPKFATMTIHKWDSPAGARSQLDPLVKTQSDWVATSGYGDPGYAYDQPERPDPVSPQLMLTSALYYARDCYTVFGQAGYDFATNNPIPPGSMRDMAAAVDRELQKYPCTQPPTTASPTPEGDVDLKVDHMEVVQVVQTYDNKIPLVANKKTVVRVFVRAVSDAPNRGPYTVGASLTIWPEGKSEVEVQPTYEATGVMPNQSPDRNRTTASINFIIPDNLTAPGVFSLKAVVNPDHAIKELDYSNNDDRQPFEFVQRNSLRIGFVRIGYKPPDQTSWAWPTDNISNAATLLKRIYPVADNGVQYYEMPWRVRVTRSLATLAADADLVWTLRELYDSIQGDKPDILVGWLPGAADTIGGGLSDVPVSGQEPRVAWILDDNRNTSLPHEVGHDLGLLHTGTTGDPAADCTLAMNKDPNYWPQEYGNSAKVLEPIFDMEQLKVIPGNTRYDLMSYCSNKEALSPFHYRKLFDANLRPQGTGDTSAKEMIQVRATLTGDAAQIEAVNLAAPATGGGVHTSPASPASLASPASATGYSMDPLNRLPSFAAGLALPFASSGMTMKYADVQRVGTGNYCLRFMGTKALLYERCFDVDFQSPETMETIDPAGFVLSVPDPGKVASVHLVRNDNGQEKELTALTVSAHAPTIAITSPKAGDRWEGEHTITWTGSDEDGDNLRYDIEYSADGKKTWSPLEVGTHDTQYTFSTDEILPSEQTYIRILASDGYNTTAADVGPVVVPKQANSPNPPPPPLPPSDSVTQQVTSSSPTFLGTDSHNIGLIAAIAGGAALVVLVGIMLLAIFRRKPRTQPATQAVYAPQPASQQGNQYQYQYHAPQPPQRPQSPQSPQSLPIQYATPPAPLAAPAAPAASALVAQYRRVEQEYGRLWGELAARRLAPQQYEGALRQLMVRDAHGRSWMIDPHTGQWLVYDGRAWIPARPY